MVDYFVYSDRNTEIVQLLMDNKGMTLLRSMIAVLFD
jgi:hypothetical protein